MSISSVTSKVVYVGDESATIFPYPFRILEETDLVVSRYTVATGSTSVMALNTDYVVSGVGDAGGGNITLTGSAVAVSSGAIYVHSGNHLVIQRIVPLTQTTDYVANDPFPAETHEAALDKLTMATHQLQEQIDRCIKADISQTTGSTTYTQVVAESVAAANAASTVAVSAAAVAVASEAAIVGDAAAAAASAVLASLSAASVSSGVTRALDNLIPTGINESLVAGASDAIDLGSNTVLWSKAYITLVSTGTLKTTLVTSTTLRVSGTSNFVTLATTLLTAASLRVSGTANTVTLDSTLLSGGTLNISGTSSFVTLTNLIIPNVAADPGSPVTGQIWFRTDV
jgi:hypothetical protein